MKKPMATMDKINKTNKVIGSAWVCVLAIAWLAMSENEYQNVVDTEEIRQDGCHIEREKWSEETFILCGDEISDEEG